MSRKLIKYGALLILAGVVLFNSIYFEKLDEHRSLTAEFDAAAYAQQYWNEKLMPALSGAIGIDSLATLLKTDKDRTFDQFSNALGIGNIRYFLVKGEGIIAGINENDVSLQIIPGNNGLLVKIATEFVFGNAVRDASAGIDINEFTNTMDFNNVSNEINKIIRSSVLPPFKAAAKTGDKVAFSGAVELNREHPDIANMEVIPVVLKIIE